MEAVKILLINKQKHLSTIFNKQIFQKQDLIMINGNKMMIKIS